MSILSKLHFFINSIIAWNERDERSDHCERSKIIENYKSFERFADGIVKRDLVAQYRSATSMQSNAINETAWSRWEFAKILTFVR